MNLSICGQHFFDKIFHLVFLLYFSVIRWNFGIVLVLFNGGSMTVGRMDINWPSYCTTDLWLCFRICENPVFSWHGSYSITGVYTGIQFLLFLL